MSTVTMSPGTFPARSRPRPPEPAVTSAPATARAITAFAAVAIALESVTDVDDLLRDVAGQVRDLVGVQRCVVALHSEETGTYHGRVGCSGPDIVDEHVQRSLAGVPVDGITAEIVATRRAVIVDDVQSDRRLGSSTVPFWNIRSMMAVPLLLGERVIGVMYLDDLDRTHAFTAQDAEVALVFGRLVAVALRNLHSSTELRSAASSAQREIRALRRALAVQERLGDLVAGGGSLGELLESLSALIGKPCAVYDSGHRPLASASPPGLVDGIVPRLLDGPQAQSAAVRTALDGKADSRVFVIEPMPREGITRRHLVAPILVEGELWGRLVVMEHLSRLSSADMLAVRRAASLIALQMSAARRAEDDMWTARTTLVAELLAGHSDVAGLRRRSSRLGIRLERPHFVVALRMRDGGAGSMSARAVVAAFAAAAPDLAVQATPLESHIAVLAELPDGAQGEPFPAWVKSLVGVVLAGVDPGHGVVAGISALVAEPGDYAAAFREARQVAECILRFGADGGPCALSSADLGPGRVFLATCDRDEVLGFAEETFGGLTDDPSKIDLLTTLCCFFENMGSIRRCALLLGVHENTIRYRLSRVEELTGVPLTHDPDGQLRARLSLLVLTLQNRLPQLQPAPAVEA